MAIKKVVFMTTLIILAFAAMLAQGETKQEQSASGTMEEMYRKAEIINDRYVKTVRPIFVSKCFDCHSTQTHYPWYHALPLVQQLLDKDIAEGRKHLDLTDDFPFAGHGAADEDLKAIQNSITKKEMPPWKYLFMHPKARLTDNEKKEVNSWINESLKILQTK